MAIIITDDKHYRNIADKIREKTGETDLIKSSEMSNKITSIYDKGYSDGQQVECDTFWDTYQTNGTRGNYQNAFSGYGWTDATFKPKYDIKPTSAMQMFQISQITNLKQILDDSGVILDFSNCATLQYAFQQSQITHIGVIDTRKCANLNYFMPNSKMIYIEKLILKSDGSQTFTSAYSFSACYDLEHMLVEGVIGKNGFDIHWSTKLDADSLASIINCLSSTATGLTVTLPITAESNYDAVYGEGAWKVLLGTKANWSIAYL